MIFKKINFIKSKLIIDILKLKTNYKYLVSQ